MQPSPASLIFSCVLDFGRGVPQRDGGSVVVGVWKAAVFRDGADKGLSKSSVHL